jgi:ribonuclease BN (tRNA processing enzyme)
MPRVATLIFLLCITLAAASNGRAAECPPAKGVALQVLGSGGPVADDGRASSGYLVWLDGHARALVDAGGGSFLRFGEAGARFEDLEIIALSHYHTDHSAALPALLKSGYFSPRQRPLVVSGPAAGGPFPGLAGFLSGLLDERSGAFGYLAGYLDGSDGLVRLDPREVASAGAGEQEVFNNGSFKITARNVPHGIVPTVAYRVEVAGNSIVFASDQNGSDESFMSFARDADLLVMHLAIPGSADPAARALHATPARIGEIAHGANAGALVLGHFMARSLQSLDRNIGEVRSSYSGPLQQAADLACYRP